MGWVWEIDRETAEDALRAAVACALDMAVAVSVAVVDGGGVLKAFVRMDGAEIAGPTLAVDKAYTAVAHRTDTAELGQQSQPHGALWGLQANGGGRYILFGGGIPVWSGGRVVAGVGVSGAIPDQDVACARAAVKVIQARISQGGPGPAT